jgi:hypothetical protein
VRIDPTDATEWLPYRTRSEEHASYFAMLRDSSDLGFSHAPSTRVVRQHTIVRLLARGFGLRALGFSQVGRTGVR